MNSSMSSFHFYQLNIINELSTLNVKAQSSKTEDNVRKERLLSFVTDIRQLTLRTYIIPVILID